MQLVAISGKRRSGKSTLGNVLKDEFGFHPVSLAEPLKRMAMKHFDLTKDQVDGDSKEVLDLRYGLTPRRILIEMGQFYRSFDKDFWVKKLFNQISQVGQAQMQKFVVTDVRFKNEIEWMKKHNAFCVRLERSEELTGPYINDTSETELDDYAGWDLHVPANENVDMSDMARIGDIVNARILSKV